MMPHGMHRLKDSEMSPCQCGLWPEGYEMELSCSVLVPKLQMRNFIIQIEVLSCHSPHPLLKPHNSEINSH